VTQLAAPQRSNGNGKRSTEEPPQNREVSLTNEELERTFIGSFLDQPSLLDHVQLHPEHFAFDAHQRIAQAVQMVAVEDVVNLPNVAVLLKKIGRLEQVGGSKYIADLALGSPACISPEDAQSWAAKLRDLWEKRQALAEARALVAKLEAGSVADHFEACRASAERIERLRPTEQVSATKKRRQLIEDVIGEWRESGAVEHVDTGIHTLDRACRGGMAIPRRVLLVGAPSAGKTFVEIVIAERFLTVLRARGFIVGILAVDEYTGDVLARFAQMNGFAREEIEARQPATLDEIESKLSNAALGFYDADWTLDEVIADLAEWSKATGKKVVLFVDSMHTARCEASETARSPKELVEMNLRILKTANLQHKFTIIATAEMNRYGYANPENADKANKMSLAAEARAFEYWAEVMIVLQSMNDFPDTTHAIIAKNRGGSKDVHFWLRLDHERHTFDEVGDPNTNPELVAKVEESKRSATNAKVVRDANDLAKFILKNPGLGTKELRTKVNIERSLGWGNERTDKALAALKAGLTDYELTVTVEGKSRLHDVVVRVEGSDE
jgi:replicative DNA helicase